MENRKNAARKKVATKATTSAGIKNKRVDKKAKGILSSLTQEEKDFIEGKNFPPPRKSKDAMKFWAAMSVMCFIGIAYLVRESEKISAIELKKKRSAVKTKKAVVATKKISQAANRKKAAKMRVKK